MSHVYIPHVGACEMSDAIKELTPEPWLTGELKYPEGMRWANGHLWFSDILNAKVRTAEFGQQATPEIASIPELPSGLGFHPDGSLLIVSMNDCSVMRLKDGEVELFAHFRDQG